MNKKSKWLATLSTTEPYNNIGIIQVRQGNINSETWYIPIAQNGAELNFITEGIKKVYFCTKFSNKYVVEQEAEIIDAQKGHIKYVMNEFDMQKLGLQQAYFKFEDGEGNYRGTTQSFTYRIIESIDSSCSEMGSYVASLEELFKLYQDFYNQQKQDATDYHVDQITIWEKFFNDYRKIIESIDPGGIVLREIVEARGDFSSLKERFESFESSKQERSSVSYADFGANGEPKFYNELDGKYYLDAEFKTVYDHDDGIEIKKAHEFANNNGLKVINYSGHYVIKSNRNIPVLTDVDLVGSFIHADESFATFEKGELFNILPSSTASKRINKNEDEAFFIELLKYAKKGATYLPPLKKYSGMMGYFGNENKMVGKRYSPQTDGDAQHDWFLIKEDGYIDGELSWTYDDLTYLYVKEIDHKTLTFKGGTFLLNDKLKSTGPSDTRLVKNGIHSTRSNVVIDTYVRFEDGLTSSQTDANCQGFFTGSGIINMNLENVKVPPRKLVYTSEGKHKGGTYSIAFDHVVNLTLNNVVSEGDIDSGYWGTMGTNYIKNLKVINSKLNRIDCHFYVVNADIIDCSIDSYGIYLTGMGKLNIIRTRVRNSTYLQFRDDYGCLWDGEINIENPYWVIPNKPVEASFISFSDVKNFDHGYDFIFSNKISLNNATITFEEKSEETILNLIKFTVNKMLTEKKVYYPSWIDIEDVIVEGRDIGVDVYLHINRPDLAYVKNEAKNMYYQEKFYINVLKQNATYSFDNIQTSGRLIDPSYQQESCIRLITTATPEYTETSLLPKIIISNSDYLFVALNRALTKTILTESTLTALVAYFGGRGQSEISMSNVDLQPDLRASNSPYQMIGNYVTYSDVTLKPIKLNGNVDLQASETNTGLFILGSKVFTIYYANFSNFNLDPRLIKYFRSGPSTVENTDRFLKELKSSRPTNFFDESSGNGYTV